MLRNKNVYLIALTSIACLTVAVVGRYAYLLQGQSPTAERVLRTSTGSQPHYDPIQYRAKDSRPAISEPEFMAADEVRLAGGTKGIGVAINGDYRFYSLYVLQYHQIVNDTCGGTAVACSY